MPTTTLDRVYRVTRAAIPGRLGIDTRALATFRAAVGALLVADLLLRSRDLVAFYTDRGVLPRAALFDLSYPQRVTVHAASGEAWFQILLFVVAAAAAVALALGYRTRVATVVSWLLLLSLHNRNPVVLNGGDILLRMALFWAMFLPLGERWSVDARRASEPPRDRVTSVATAALLGQVVVVYTANAALKLGGDLWISGEAIRYVFSLDQFTVLLGDVVKRYPGVLTALDRLWLAMLVGSALLVLLTGVPRLLLALLFVGGHLGMLLTMRLGLFPLVAVAALLPFLPPAVWDRASAVVDARTRSVREGRSPAPGRLLRAADDALPEVTVAGVPSVAERWGARLSTAVALAFVALVLLWNLQTLGVAAVPDAADPAARATGVDQRWNMFAPEPMRTDGWYVVPGRLEDGSSVDAFHRSRVTWERPDDVASAYPTARWRKYLVNLWRPGYHAHHRHFATYLCRRWNADHDTRLESLDLYFVEQPTRLDGPEPTSRELLYHHECSAGG
jgi:hypothetical protein